MKKVFLAFFLIAFTTGCEDKNEINEQHFRAAKIAAMNSTGQISELPFGFHFGMTSKVAKSTLDSLVNTNIIEKTNSGYWYDYNLNDEIILPMKILCQYHYDSLYALTFDFSRFDNEFEITKRLIKDMNKKINEKISSEYLRHTYYTEIDDRRATEIGWFKENQYVLLRLSNIIGSHISNPLAELSS